MLNKMFVYVKLLTDDERGQGMVEYALVIAFVAIVVLGAISLFQEELSGLFTTITNSL